MVSSVLFFMVCVFFVLFAPPNTYFSYIYIYISKVEFSTPELHLDKLLHCDDKTVQCNKASITSFWILMYWTEKVEKKKELQFNQSGFNWICDMLLRSSLRGKAMTFNLDDIKLVLIYLSVDVKPHRLGR